MKTLQRLLIAILLVWVIACQKHEGESRAQMLLDDQPSGNNVTMVKQKQAVGPDETVSDLKDLTNIMQSDLEAKERTPSKEVVYVKLGEAARPAEQRK